MCNLLFPTEIKTAIVDSLVNLEFLQHLQVFHEVTSLTVKISKVCVNSYLMPDEGSCTLNRKKKKQLTTYLRV